LGLCLDDHNEALGWHPKRDASMSTFYFYGYFL
jgi:hypothetical protein